MKRKGACALMVCVAGAALGGTALWAGAVGMIDVDVTVSPKNIVLGLDKGDSVTVHTDIPYATVDGSSVALSGVPAYLTKADCRGNLVGKFDQAAIEALVAPPSATLVLTGTTVDGEPFSGSDTVRVMEDPMTAQPFPRQFRWCKCR